MLAGDWMSRRDKKSKSQLMKLTKAALVDEVTRLQREVELREQPSDAVGRSSDNVRHPRETAISTSTAKMDSLEFLRLVIESAPQYIFWKNDRHEYLGCNLNFARAAGFAKVEEVIGKKDEDMAWSDEDAAEYVRSDSEIMASNRAALHIVKPFHSADGVLRYIDSSRVPLRDLDGNVIGIIGFFDDVTELKKHQDRLEQLVAERTAEIGREAQDRRDAEEALRENEGRLQFILEASPIGVGISDLKTGEILYANKKCARLFGFDEGRELLGKTTIEHWVDPDQRDVFRGIFLRDGRVPPKTMRMQDIHAKQYWAQTSWDPIEYKGHEAILFWAYDITVLKDAEQDLQSLNENLQREAEERRQAQFALEDAMVNLEERVQTRTAELEKEMQRAELANRTKTEFLNNMSHELRTPLNAVIGFSDMMRNEYLGPMENKTYLGYADDINQSGTYLLSIINDILDVSRIEAGAIELEETEVILASIVENCMEMIRERARNSELRLEKDLQENMPLVWADARRLKQVLLNLLSNAMKFTAEGGLIQIRTYLDKDDEGEACPVIEVSDSGIGIDPDNLKEVMEPFGKVESSMVRKHEGIGLGLPIVKALVEQHDGRLDIDSRAGRGTRVLVTLPAKRILTN